MQAIPYEKESLNKLLTLNEVAHLLRIHPSTIRRWEKDGHLKSYRLGPKGSIRFKAADITKFIELDNRSR